MDREEKLQLLLDRFSECGMIRKDNDLWVGDEKIPDEEIDRMVMIIHKSIEDVKRMHMEYRKEWAEKRARKIETERIEWM